MRGSNGGGDRGGMVSKPCRPSEHRGGGGGDVHSIGSAGASSKHAARAPGATGWVMKPCFLLERFRGGCHPLGTWRASVAWKMKNREGADARRPGMGRCGESTSSKKDGAAGYRSIKMIRANPSNWRLSCKRPCPSRIAAL